MSDASQKIDHRKLPRRKRRLSVRDQAILLAFRTQGLTQPQLAADFHLSQSRISQILRRAEKFVGPTGAPNPAPALTPSPPPATIQNPKSEIKNGFDSHELENQPADSDPEQAPDPSAPSLCFCPPILLSLLPLQPTQLATWSLRPATRPLTLLILLTQQPPNQPKSNPQRRFQPQIKNPQSPIALLFLIPLRPASPREPQSPPPPKPVSPEVREYLGKLKRMNAQPYDPLRNPIYDWLKPLEEPADAKKQRGLA